MALNSSEVNDWYMTEQVNDWYMTVSRVIYDCKMEGTNNQIFLGTVWICNLKVHRSFKKTFTNKMVKS